MEQINYQEEFRRVFSAYRANSEEPDGTARQSMKALIDKFPYCQPVHFMHAASLKNNPATLESLLPKISILASQREKLHQIIHHPERIILQGTIFQPVKEDPGFKEAIDPAPEAITETDTIDPQIIPEKETQKQDHSPEQINTNSQDNHVNEFVSEDEPDLETGEDESLLMDTIVSENYFTLDKPDITDQHEEETKNHEVASAPDHHQGNSHREKEFHHVSRYHDDKMPFTFLWWLNKTRKEHADTYQPYVSFKLDTSRPIGRNIKDELNQQIMENIFHLQIPIDDKKSKKASNTVEFKVKRKDEEIIEKFIKEDPQIRPMQPDNISTENKARKSSEDLNDVVSETLARIYIEQMLYHKAIDTYKKLSLKFPEKNAYFADQISDLEKKIN